MKRLMKITLLAFLFTSCKNEPAIIPVSGALSFEAFFKLDGVQDGAGDFLNRGQIATCTYGGEHG